jgi:hypothetical protein
MRQRRQVKTMMRVGVVKQQGGAMPLPVLIFHSMNSSSSISSNGFGGSGPPEND